MKTSLIVLLLLLIGFSVSAQTATPDSTRSTSASQAFPDNIGFEWNLQLANTQMFQRSDVMTFQSGMNVLLDHKVMVGMTMGGITNTVVVPQQYALPGIERSRWKMSYFGLTFGRVLFSHSPVNLTLDATVGFGGVSKHALTRGTYSQYNDLEDSNFLLLQPEARLNFRLGGAAQAYVAGGYRFCSNTATLGASSNNLSGYYIGAGIGFGHFRKK